MWTHPFTPIRDVRTRLGCRTAGRRALWRPGRRPADKCVLRPESDNNTMKLVRLGLSRILGWAGVRGSAVIAVLAGESATSDPLVLRS